MLSFFPVSTTQTNRSTNASNWDSSGGHIRSDIDDDEDVQKNTR